MKQELGDLLALASSFFWANGLTDSRCTAAGMHLRFDKGSFCTSVKVRAYKHAGNGLAAPSVTQGPQLRERKRVLCCRNETSQGPPGSVRLHDHVLGALADH